MKMSVPCLAYRAVLAATVMTGVVPVKIKSATASRTQRQVEKTLALVASSTTGYPVPDHQLDRLFSVPCLKVKQRYGGHVPCNYQEPEIKKEIKQEIIPPPALDIGTYPNWQEPRCRSNGEFFCDPEAVLSENETRNVTLQLGTMREQAVVKCGQLPCKLAGSDSSYKRQFFLGVAIADDWPSGEADPMTLQRFGLVLLGRWGLLPWYNGVNSDVVAELTSMQQYATNCPNSAMLIILPKYRQAFVSSPSCEFICSDRGGPEVATAVLAALEDQGLAAAVSVGIQTAQGWLARTEPLSLQRSLTDMEIEKGYLNAQRHFFRRESTWAAVQITVFVSISLCLIAVCVNMAYTALKQDKELSLRRSR